MSVEPVQDGARRPPPRRGRRRVGVIAGTSVVLLGGGIASAAWLASGTGPAAGQARTAVEITVTAGTPTPNLFPLPGSSTTYAAGPTPVPGTVYVNLRNDNPYPVSLTGASYGAVTVTPVGGRTCASTNVGPAPSGAAPPTVTLAAAIPLAAGESRANVAIPGALYMAQNAPDGCQGATVSVQVTLSGTSV